MFSKIGLSFCLLTSQLNAQDADHASAESSRDPVISVRKTLSIPREIAPAIQPYMQCIFAAQNSLIGQRISAASPEYRKIVLGKCSAERETALVLATKLVSDQGKAGTLSSETVAATFDNVEHTMLEAPVRESEQTRIQK